ncbi:MAG: hypothetical protein JSS67_10360 [Bacteroidetes bacterium]|nr:hypothetical protein [Bacteroidota bacterium]
MKKLILAILCISFSAVVFSQNYNGITLFIAQQKFDKAKIELDKLMADSKGKENPKTYFFALQLYSELYADSALHQQYPDAGQKAIDALHEYVAKDSTLKDLKEEGPRPIGIMYSSAFNNGRKYFMESNWDEAFNNFKIAEEMSAFANENGFSENKIKVDTTTILYTGYAAQNAGKTDEAVQRYKKLADEKIGGKDFEEIYKFILNYDTQKKTEADFKKYLAIAKELYPADDAMWSQFDVNYMGETADMTEVMNKYQQDEKAGILKVKDYVAYAEMFAQPDKEKMKNLDSLQQVNMNLLSADAYAKAYALEPNGIYLFNAGVLTYNLFGVLDQRFYDLRGESASLKKQRDSVVAQQMVYANKSIEYLEQAYSNLKAKTDRTKVESNSLNRAVDYLANLYIWKRDKSKGVSSKDYDAFDAKFKLYDSEHDKYKQ